MHKNSGGWLVSSVLVSSVVLGGCTAGHSVAATPNSAFARLDTAPFNSLKGGRTLDLIEERLESKGYQPSGYPVLPLPASLKAAILTHEQSSPTRYTPNASALASCKFWGIRIELDNKPDMRSGCLHQITVAASNPLGRSKPSGYCSNRVTGSPKYWWQTDLSG